MKNYYFFVLLSLFFLIWRYRYNTLSILIVLCFYSGLAAYHGKAIENPYKILLTILSVYLLFKFNTTAGLRIKEKFLIFIFLLFSLSFFLSGYINHDSFNMVFSQYGKYVPPICLFLILNHIIKTCPQDIHYYKDLFFSLLTVQIILTFFKWGLIGIKEWYVGSISFNGGGIATPLPVLGFMLLWLHTRGELKRKDWVYVILLLIIAFVSLKRAIWFIMPFFVLMFLYYVPKKVDLKKLVYYIPIVPLIFYLGIRFNPTLNKEGKFGGSFDPKFAYDYVMSYSFGKTEDNKAIKVGHGRGGATLFIWDKFAKKNSLSVNDYLGYGLTKMYASDYAKFNTYKFGISDMGSATGIVQTYVTSGFIGIFITLILLFSIVWLIIDPRIRFTIGLFVFYDYLFYSGLVFRMSALLVLLFFIIICSNLISTNKINVNNNPV